MGLFFQNLKSSFLNINSFKIKEREKMDIMENSQLKKSINLNFQKFPQIKQYCYFNKL